MRIKLFHLRWNPRVLLSLFLLLLIYDGAIRKWLLPNIEQIVFITKDVLLLFALVYWLKYWKATRTYKFPAPVLMVFALYVTWVILEVFNFSLPNLAVGVWGAKSHILYTSLLFLIPLSYKSLDELLSRIAQIYPIVVVPVCALAFVQILSPAASWINKSVAGDMIGISSFGFGEIVRVSGTFSFLSGLSAFVQAMSLLGIGLYLYGERSYKFLIGLAVVIAALPVSGSRSVVFVFIIAVFIMAIFSLIGRVIDIKKLLQLIIVLFILGFISLFFQPEVWDAFFNRVERADAEGKRRMVTAVTNAFDYFDMAGFTGWGTGSANLGAAGLAGDVPKFSWLPNGTTFEEESGRIVIEIGIFGWLLSLAMRLSFFIWSVMLVLEGRTRSVRIAGIIAIPVMGLAIYQGNGIFSPPYWAAYFWFCVTLLGMAQYEQNLNRSRNTFVRRARRT